MALLEAHTAVSVGVSGVKEAQMLGPELLQRHSAVTVQIRLTWTVQPHEEQRRVWWDRRHWRRRRSCIRIAIATPNAIAVDNHHAALGVALAVFLPVFGPWRFAATLDGDSAFTSPLAIFTLSVTNHGDAPLGAFRPVCRLHCGGAIVALEFGSARPVHTELELALAAILEIEAFVVIGVEFGEHTLGGRARLGARHPAVAIGIHAHRRPSSMAHNDACMVRLGVGGHRKRGEGHA
jgi:hypothetical protein